MKSGESYERPNVIEIRSEVQAKFEVKLEVK